jgi:SAM-dependent methyltransferase
MAYGATMLSEAGAKSVVGLDLAQVVLDAARSSVPVGVELVAGDVRELPFADDAFDLIVCFEVIEHILEQEQALAEFRRVLCPDGVLIVSSPNRDVNVPGNPHHARELTPPELEAILLRHFASTTLVRQHDFVMSTILDDETLRCADGRALPDAEVFKVAGREPGEETYTLALAGDQPAFADGAALGVITAPIQVREWVERFHYQQQELERAATALDDAERRLAEREQLLERLAEAETKLAELAPLQRSLALATAERRDATIRLVDAEREVQVAVAARRRVEEARSWKLTAPLRRGGALARAFMRGQR